MSTRRYVRLPAGLLAPLTMALAAATLVATPAGCGGAAEQDVLDSNPTGAGTSGTSGTSGTGTSGSSGTTTSGGAGDASADSASACAEEVEPNDDRDDANVLAPSRCGTIQPNSESDFLTFELKPTSTSLQVKFEGKVTLEIEVDGNSVTLGAGPGPRVPFVKGERYVIRIKATSRENKVPWRVDLIEQ